MFTLVIRGSDNVKIKYHLQLRIHTGICLDIAVEENLIVYIQLLSAASGLSETHFLSLSQLPGATAEQIVTSLPEVFEKNKKIDLDNLCAVAIDGDTTVSRVRAEVITRLKEKCPGILSCHISHWIAPVFQQTLQKMHCAPLNTGNHLATFTSYLENSLQNYCTWKVTWKGLGYCIMQALDAIFTCAT